MMNRHDRDILLALVTCGLAASDTDVASRFAPLFGEGADKPDWQSIYKHSSVQGVLAVAWDGLQRLADAGVIADEMMPDPKIAIHWVGNVQIIENTYSRQERAIARLSRFLSEHDIRMMLLKGYGLSLCYPVPEHRPCGDIDIWLYGRQSDADRLLREKGVKIDEDKHHHTVFFIGRVMVENHFDFLNVHSHSSNRGLEQILQTKAAASSETVEVDGSRVELPPADFNALFLLRHAAGHYAAENIGLRHIVDWAVFVRHYGASVDWQWLESVAREYNMHRFLHCLNVLAVECTGIDEKLFPLYEHDELEERVLNDILDPEFKGVRPASGFLKLNIYRLRRWWANRWKHQLVYREGLIKTFIVQLHSHLIKPKSFTC